MSFGFVPARIISIIICVIFFQLQQSPLNVQEITTVPAAGASGSTHHEHHPGDGFSVLFVWALPTAARVPLMSNKRSQSPCPATHPARTMSIIWVMSFGFVPGTHHQHHHLRDAKVLSIYKRSQKSLLLEHPAARTMSIIRVVVSPSYLSGPFQLQEITKPVPCNPPSAHHEHHLGDVFRARPGHASSAKSSQYTRDHKSRCCWSIQQHAP